MRLSSQAIQLQAKHFEFLINKNLVIEKSVHIVFDEFNDLSFKDVSRNVRIEKNMENLEISQENQETHEEAGEKEI